MNDKQEFIIQKFNIDNNEDDIPISEIHSKMNHNKYKKSFSLLISLSRKPIFFCRLFYIDYNTRKKLNIKYKYELADLYLYNEYQNKLYNGIKYSKICINMLISYLESINIKNILLFVFNNNIKAIKRYESVGFIKNTNKKLDDYYYKLVDKYYKNDINIYVYNK